jgi:hypothetical protein
VGIIVLSLTEGDDAKCESFHMGLGFLASGAVGENAWNLSDFCDPPSVVFQLEFDVEVQESSLEDAVSSPLKGDI